MHEGSVPSEGNCYNILLSIVALVCVCKSMQN